MYGYIGGCFDKGTSILLQEQIQMFTLFLYHIHTLLHIPGANGGIEGKGCVPESLQSTPIQGSLGWVFFRKVFIFVGVNWRFVHTEVYLQGCANNYFIMFFVWS